MQLEDIQSTMRKALTGCALFIGIVATPVESHAQGPRSISFQGYLTDAAGNPIDGSRAIIAKFFPGPAGGVALWTRDYGSIAIDNGVFNLSFDGGSPNIADVSFDDVLWLELTVSGEVIGPRTVLESSPYSRGLILPLEASRIVDGLGEAALKITNLASSGDNYAISGVSNASGGNGIRGWATSITGNNSGVYGESASTTGRGVFGRATSASGVNYGVFGQSASTTGRGLLGWATAGSGEAYGVYGESASTTGRAIYGLATNAAGVNYGVYGETVSSNAVGVYGAGGQFGVQGEINSAFGLAGVRGNNTNTAGFGGYFTGGSGTYTRGATNDLPDLMLGGNGGSNDDGRIYSEITSASSDIWIHSNDAVVVIVDNNEDGEDSDFEIRHQDPTGTLLLNVDDGGAVTASLFVQTSDRNRKEDIVPVNTAAILEEIARLPVHKWRFKDEPESHIGPMAQDFYTAFGLGADNKHIAAVDADGVALAAIQALYEIVMRQQEEIEKLKGEN